MMPKQWCSKLNEFLYKADANQIFEAVTYHSLNNTGIEQRLGPSSNISMIPAEGITAEEYLQILDKNSYSAVFDDGAVVIIQVTFRQNDLYSHRYLYIPCPIAQEHISMRDADIPLADWIEMTIDQLDIESIRSSGYLRFDYGREHGESPIEAHPISHMTFISGSCRVPVYRPLTIASFFNFVFDNYYRNHRSFWLNYSPFLSSDRIKETITPKELTLHHLDWCPD